ncbi:MAG TPA: hypothetical protein ENK84_12735 [Desulfobulbus sp.]|nr:hypothetical protein [Desulfobulbus sp.]
MKPDNDSNREISSPSVSTTLADIFGFFALLMRYPKKSFFDDEFLDTLENLLAKLDLEPLRQKICAWRSSVDDPLPDAQIEYTRLFINAAPHLIAPPYGSVYLESEVSLQGKSTETTRDFYRRYGFDIVNTAEPADHISLELEFLSCLYRQHEITAAETFVRTLFLPWFEQFYHQLMAELRHPLYEVSIQLISLFVQEDQ